MVAGEVQDAGDSVAHDRGPQVPDVHFLGHIGRGVFDRDGLRTCRPFRAEPLVVAEPAARLGRETPGLEFVLTRDPVSGAHRFGTGVALGEAGLSALT